MRLDVKCNELKNAKNLIVQVSNGRSFGSVITYSCPSPYTLRGSSKRSCRAIGEWDGRKTRCSECIIMIPLIEGLPGVLGNMGTLAKYPREQGNMSLFWGNRGTKLYKIEEEKIVSKFIKRGTNAENVQEHGNIRKFCKGTRNPPGRPSLSNDNQLICAKMSMSKPAESKENGDIVLTET